MYYVKINNEILVQKNDLFDIVIEFNEILSKLYVNVNVNEKDIPNYILSINKKIIIQIEVNNKNIILESDIPSNLSVNDIYLLPFFIFSKNDLINIDSNDITLITQLNPQSLLDIFTYNNSLLNAYFVLSEIFHVSDHCIYQTFTLYLNKTIYINPETTKFNMDTIIGNFVKNDNFIDNLKYKNLFIYYIASKQIFPFKIKYEKYISKFN